MFEYTKSINKLASLKTQNCLNRKVEKNESKSSKLCLFSNLGEIEPAGGSARQKKSWPASFPSRPVPLAPEKLSKDQLFLGLTKLPNAASWDEFLLLPTWHRLRDWPFPVHTSPCTPEHYFLKDSTGQNAEETGRDLSLAVLTTSSPLSTWQETSLLGKGGGARQPVLRSCLRFAHPLLFITSDRSS